MDTAAAIRHLRADPASADLIRDAYLDADVQAAADRFGDSAEWAATRELLATTLVPGCVALDLGAGNGIASAALARVGARVVALDPDPGNDVGLGALRVVTGSLPVAAVVGVGESIPLPDGVVDLVYGRQVLHHAADLPQMLGECARVLRPGGIFFACREHVVDDEAQLAEFLAWHPVHQLAGGEHAFSLSEYLAAIEGAGLKIDRLVGPLDSVINAFPHARSDEEVRTAPRDRLRARFGTVGGWLGALAPGLVRARMNQQGAGRLYAFLARKP